MQTFSELTQSARRLFAPKKPSGASTPDVHALIQERAVALLARDGFSEAARWYQAPSRIGLLRAFAAAPDRAGDFERGIGMHYYCSIRPDASARKASASGQYFPNGSGAYARSARTLFEEDITMALLAQRSALPALAMESLSRAAHFLADSGCFPHAAGLTYSSRYRTVHQSYETMASHLVKCVDIPSSPAAWYLSLVDVPEASGLLRQLAVQTAADHRLVMTSTTQPSPEWEQAIRLEFQRCVQYTAVLFLRFYRETHAESRTQRMRLRNGSSVALRHVQTGRYLDAGGELGEEPVWFRLCLCTDCSVRFVPVANAARPLTTARFQAPEAYRLTRLDGEVYRISSASCNYAKVLNGHGARAAASAFDPDNPTQLWKLMERREV